MLKILSPTGSSTILQSVEVADEDEIGKSGGNETNLSNLSVSTRFTKAGYLISEALKRAAAILKSVSKPLEVPIT